jgi:hypothetical protein
VSICFRSRSPGEPQPIRLRLVGTARRRAQWAGSPPPSVSWLSLLEGQACVPATSLRSSWPATHAVHKDTAAARREWKMVRSFLPRRNARPTAPTHGNGASPPTIRASRKNSDEQAAGGRGLPCGYRAACLVPWCRRRATTILRYLDTHFPWQDGAEVEECLLRALRWIDEEAAKQ